MEYTIDAKNKSMGRIATEIALILQGKKNAKYNPRLEGTDKVVVLNIKEMAYSGNKLIGRKYYRHTGYMGHLKESTLQERLTKNPERVLQEVVRHMLPKNRLAVKRLKRLIIK